MRPLEDVPTFIGTGGEPVGIPSGMDRPEQPDHRHQCDPFMDAWLKGAVTGVWDSVTQRYEAWATLVTDLQEVVRMWYCPYCGKKLTEDAPLSAESEEHQ